eukprot:CAMPEP_0181314012 /NCGR_PEP_ID=MMETSP1101-20121128/14573_1 /TAXON_ID=46948 /ORGANISM="Rhodomonas abbreviata, Strain Caron Lab Isolate" /LENGTH=201 /DNA_ID=CAMNT_0023421041 /DNA_START=111 /DNA_END=716 /DNA_ORIENTATION=-
MPGINWKMILSPILVYAIETSHIDWTDPFNLNAARAAYAAVTLCIAILKLWLYRKINASYDERRVKMKPSKGVTGEEIPARELSVTDHDLEQLQASARTWLMATLISVGIHSWKGWYLPIIFQCFSQPLMAYDAPLFQIHVLGFSDSGDHNPLKRPWAASPKNAFEEVYRQANMMDPRNRQEAERRKEKKKAAKQLLARKR